MNKGIFVCPYSKYVVDKLTYIKEELKYIIKMNANAIKITNMKGTYTSKAEMEMFLY